jgi:hypothetical protein
MRGSLFVLEKITNSPGKDRLIYCTWIQGKLHSEKRRGNEG